MRMILGLFFLTVSLPLLANTRKITTQIHSVDYGNPGEEVLVFLMSGDVARATEANLEMIEDVQEAKSNSEWLTLTLDKDRHILSVDGASAPVAKSTEKDFDLDGIDSTPTGLEGVETYPVLIAELLGRGFSEADCEKIAGGNLLRAMATAEKVAASMAGEVPPDVKP